MSKVSVVIASFNHEKYVRECIQSALDQTYQDFEVLVTDDGSADGTVGVIKDLRDARIHLNVFAQNEGACRAANDCIRRASGEYVALLNSDDAWEPTKLQEQVAFMDNHPDIGACFTRVAFVDESGMPIKAQDYRFSRVFDVQNRSRSAWLNHFFFKGNCLCHPSILIRRRCYDDIGLYDERMASIPDLDAWVRLCLKYEIHILDKRLIRFRIREHEANASGDLLPNHVRVAFEYKQMLNHYLRIRDSGFFLETFPQATRFGEVKEEYIPYFLSRLALQAGDNFRDLWGLEVLHGLLGSSTTAAKLEENYGFRYRDLHRLAAERNVFGLPSGSDLQNLFRLLRKIPGAVLSRIRGSGN